MRSAKVKLFDSPRSDSMPASWKISAAEFIVAYTHVKLLHYVLNVVLMVREAGSLSMRRSRCKSHLSHGDPELVAIALSFKGRAGIEM